MKPLITVYLITHNRLNLLKRSLTSVQKQDYENLEIIIVDDASKDGTQDFIKREAQIDKRIKYLRNGKNMGACASRNKAIMAATGEYITGLDDDDAFSYDRISLFTKEISEYKSVLFFILQSCKQTFFTYKKI